jgi:ABC-type sugar transport system ATPase subunit
MATLQFRGINKRFGTTVVATDLSLDIADGELLVMLGPSGCGKSTLLHLVAGIATPDSGTIFIDGVDVSDIPPQHRDVAMVFQNYALYPHLDVFGNLAFPLRNRGMKGMSLRREVEQVAAALGLTLLLDKRPGQLSGGQRQRVALGRALIRRPVAFLMDEPLSNLDAALRLDVREEIKRVHEMHRITTLYVTHDQEEAMVLADRIAVLHDGAIVQCDTPQAVYTRPADTFVARFVGTPPMNLVPAAELAKWPALAEHLHGVALETTLIGVRPHEIEARNVGDGTGPVARVLLLEPTGMVTWVVAELGGCTVKARLADGTVLVPRADAQLAFAPGSFHRFDAASGRRLAD